MERLAELLEDDLDALATRTKRLTAEEPGTAEPVCPVRFGRMLRNCQGLVRLFKKSLMALPTGEPSPPHVV